MKYDLEFDEGGEAATDGYPATWNPYAWHTPQWYAWDAGWNRARVDNPLTVLQEAQSC